LDLGFVDLARLLEREEKNGVGSEEGVDREGIGIF
jgi:hypothetical protein